MNSRSGLYCFSAVVAVVQAATLHTAVVAVYSVGTVEAVRGSNRFTPVPVLSLVDHGMVPHAGVGISCCSARCM